MKKFIPILSVAFLFAACSPGTAETETRTIQSTQQSTMSLDTAGLAQFQQWKAQNELNAAEPVQQEVAPVEAAPVRTVTVIREVRVQQPATVKRTPARRQQQAPTQERPQPVEEKPTSNTTAGNGDVASNTGSGSGTGAADAPAEQGETAKKEGGWSNAKKGAVIGAGGGAVIGAVINKKNRAAGAVIGGILGGAAGYGLGKKKDGKDVQQ